MPFLLLKAVCHQMMNNINQQVSFVENIQQDDVRVKRACITHRSFDSMSLEDVSPIPAILTEEERKARWIQ